MRTVLALMNRNRKLFFKDKGMLFTSMITPVIPMLSTKFHLQIQQKAKESTV